MNETLQKALDAVSAAQPKEESAVWMVGEQLKDILRASPELAQIVIEDFEAQKTPLADCEKKIADYAKAHRHGSSGCCTPKAAEKIIRKHFGLPEEPSVGCADSSAQGAVAVDLDRFLL